MDDLQLLSNLYQKYKIKAKETKNWVNYLKVHGLANACLARTSSEEWRLRVYEIENDWYDGKHPLTYIEHLRSIELNNQKLKQLREVSKSSFSGLEDECKKFDVFDTFSSDNLRRMESFADKVFVKSKECSNNIVEFTRGLFSTCVTNLEKVGVVAPCSFAVIGFGSVARGEATPYSDLEYGILIESDSAGTEYFEKLAVESYFRINNLGETPLKCFDIVELKANVESGIVNKFKDSLKCVGLKIDGISPKAGNIPTGNGHNEGHKLIATVDGMLQLYIDKLRAPPGDLTGDLSDLLSTSVLLYSYKSGSNLHHEFRQKLIEAYQSNESIKVYGIRDKKLATLVKDIETYNFLPENDNKQIAIQQFVGNVKVKADIFRYPTLLATNLCICFALKTTYPWDTFAKLYELQILDKEMTLYLQFILAAAIYIRMSAYLTYESQKEELSFFTPTRKTNELYYVPSELFATMSFLLIPMKEYISSSIIKIRRQPKQLNEKHLMQLLQDALTKFKIDENNFILKAELLQYIGDSEKAFQYLKSVFGERVVNSGQVFLEKLREIHGRDCSLEAHAMVVWAGTLHRATRYEPILEFYTNLLHHSRQSVSCMIIIADCFSNLHNYQMAIDVYTKIIDNFRFSLEIDNDQPLYDYAISLLEQSVHQIPENTVETLCFISSLYNALSEMYTCLSPPHVENALEYSRAAEQVCILLREKQYITLDAAQFRLINCKELQIKSYAVTHQYQQSLDVHEALMKEYHSLYGENTDHESIARSYYSIAGVYDSLGLYSSAQQQCMKALDMFHNIYGINSKHLEIVSCHTNYGLASLHAGEYAESLKHHNIALDMLLDVYGNDSEQPIIAEAYNNVGSAYRHLKLFDNSLKYHTKALKMRQKKYGRHSPASDIADSIINIGSTYYEKQEYKNSLACLIKAASIYEEVHRNRTHNALVAVYYKLGYVYFKLRRYLQAERYLKQSLAIEHSIRGKSNINDMAVCHVVLACSCYVSEDYKQSLEHIIWLSTNGAKIISYI